jgi:hypothetical protein
LLNDVLVERGSLVSSPKFPDIKKESSRGGAFEFEGTSFSSNDDEGVLAFSVAIFFS